MSENLPDIKKLFSDKGGEDTPFYYGPVMKYYTPLQIWIAGLLTIPFVPVWMIWHNFRLTGGDTKKKFVLTFISVLAGLVYLFILSDKSGYPGVKPQLFVAGMIVFASLGGWLTYKFQKPALDIKAKQGACRRHSYLFLIVLAFCGGFLHATIATPLSDGLHHVAPKYFHYKGPCEKPGDHPMQGLGVMHANKLTRNAYIQCEIERSALVGLFKWVFF